MREDVINRPFRDADAEPVISVLRENFGEDYFYEGCYDRDHLIEENRVGEHLLYVSELASGEFVGVVGAKRVLEFPGSLELSIHVLRKKFHGQGMAKPLLDYCMRQCERQMCASMFGHCVTYHTITQNEMARLGCRTTGMWLGRHQSARSFLKTYGFSPHSAKLHSLIIVKAGSPELTGALYPPEEHRAFIAGVYKEQSITREFGGESGGAPLTNGRISVKHDAETGNTDLYIPCVGADTLSQVDDALRIYDGYGQCFTALVNMRDVHCPRLCRALAGRGFYFTGVHPLHIGVEYALYHREMDGGYDWDELKLTDENRAVMEYIRAHQGEGR